MDELSIAGAVDDYPRNRSEAKERGLRFFRSRIKCVCRGHGFIRTVTSSQCRDCIDAAKLIRANMVKKQAAALREDGYRRGYMAALKDAKTAQAQAAAQAAAEERERLKQEKARLARRAKRKATQAAKVAAVGQQQAASARPLEAPQEAQEVAAMAEMLIAPRGCPGALEDLPPW